MSRADRFARVAETKAVAGDLRRKSVFGALTTGVGGALDLVLRLGSTIILARLLVPEHFGVVAMVTAFTRVAERFTSLGLSTATVQAPEVTDGQCSNLFWINAGVGLLLAAMFVVFSPAIASFYDDERLQAIAVALSLNFVWTGLAIQHEALLRRQMKLPQIAANRIVATLLSVSVAIALALGGFGYWALVWKEVAQALLLALGSWILCPWIPAAPSRRVDMGRLLRFGRDMTLTEVLLAVTSQLDSLLIGRFAGANPLGLYRQAQNLMQVPIQRLRGPIFSVSQPALSILQREPERYRRYYNRFLFVVSLATVPVGVFTAVYADEIIIVALGEKWLGSVVFLRLFSVVAALRPALATCGVVQITSGNSGRLARVTLGYSTIEMVLMFTGIKWGAVGIAAASVVTLVLGTPWLLRYSFAGTPVSVRDFMRGYLRPAVASFIVGGTLLIVRYLAPLESALLSLSMGLGVAIVLYFFTLNTLPGGRGQLRSLANESLAAMRQRRTAGSHSGRRP